MKPTDDSTPSEWREHLATIVIVLTTSVILLVVFHPELFFLQRRCTASHATYLVQDGRLLGNAAQQYFLTTGQSKATFGYDPTTGAITGDITPWLTNITKGYYFPDTTIESGSTSAFSMSYPGAFNGNPVIFSDEGKTTRNPAGD